jgi:NitT/TauT family transport system substrate-binding protein
VYVAEELLRAEGFTDISYVEGVVPGAGPGSVQILSDGRVDMAVNFAAPLAMAIDRGAEITVLGGVHPGCYELFTTPGVRSIKDLKGRTVSVLSFESAQHVFLASIATSVGLDPNRDIQWVFHPAAEGKQLLAEGKIDGYLGFPPDPQELRDKKVGRMLLSSTVDRPWSQYFCCMLLGNKEFVRKNPVATKRALRAILKSADLCAVAPERVARTVVAMGLAKNYDYTLQAIKELPYSRWREFDPEDTVRFYSLRLREVGMIKSSPQKIIAEGADWSFSRALKVELKA